MTEFEERMLRVVAHLTQTVPNEHDVDKLTSAIDRVNFAIRDVGLYIKVWLILQSVATLVELWR